MTRRDSTNQAGQYKPGPARIPVVRAMLIIICLLYYAVIMMIEPSIKTLYFCVEKRINNVVMCVHAFYHFILKRIPGGGNVM